MTDIVPAETVQSVHVTDVISQSLSTDKEAAMVVFVVAGEDGAPERKFAMTFDADKCRWMMNAFYDLYVQAMKAGKQQGTLMFHFPSDYTTGHAPELDQATFKTTGGTILPKGPKAVITFDRDRQSESSYVMMTIAACMLGKVLLKEGLPRLSHAERDQLRLIEQAELQAPKLIVP